MQDQWTQEKVQRYVEEEEEENLNLDYKAAGALGKRDGKKKEISKDISAMANSDGGIVIYGVAEHQEKDKNYLPERIDAIDRTQFSKEWLEQVITGNVRPRIDGLVIHSVSVDSIANGVVYVVEVPKSTTAHQAKDFRYYKRFNFESVPMQDYEVRDVMNRATTPDAHIEFGLRWTGDPTGDPNDNFGRDYYLRLHPVVENRGHQVINHFKVILTLTNIGVKHIGDDSRRPADIKELEYVSEDKSTTHALRWVSKGMFDGNFNLVIVYRSHEVLFPKERIDLGERIRWAYLDCNPLDEEELLRIHHLGCGPDEKKWIMWAEERKWKVDWTLYADYMPRKEGFVLVHELPIQGWHPG